MGNLFGGIGFIGAGNMAEALVGGLIASGGVARPLEITISDVRPERLIELGNKFSISLCENNRGVLSNCNTIVLSVKPQNVAEVIDDIGPAFTERHLLITICAGISTRFVERRLVGSQALGPLTPSQPRVVRVMPNTPALIRQGVAAICGGAFSSEEDLALTEAIFRAVGTTVRLDEEHMNAVTALSGSGPAYFFHLIECLIQAGEKVGLPPKAAADLVLQTAAGACAMAAKREKSPARLREMVTSPKGTTWAALEVMKERDFPAIIDDAIKAATDRAGELGQDD